LESRLIETNAQYRRSFIVKAGRLHPVPTGFHLLAPSQIWPFFRSNIFSLSGKARIAAEIFLPRRSANGTDESLAQFVRRRFGNEALERMAQPMVGGIYTADPERLSLSATFPRFLEMERTHRSIILAMRKEGGKKEVTSGTSGARYSLFLSFDEGMQVFTDALVSRIEAPNIGNDCSVKIHRNAAVNALERASSTEKIGWKVRTSTGTVIDADAVCVALPAPHAARLMQDLDQQLAAELGGIACASTATINLGYRLEDIPNQSDARNAKPQRPLRGFGFVVPYAEKRSLLACTFSSVKFPGRAPKGHVLLRAFVGGALQPEMFALSESEMLSRVRVDLQDLLGITKPPLFAEVAKWSGSMPQYEIGHINRIQRIMTRLNRFPTLRVAGNFYDGAGIPDCIRSGELAADELIRSLLD